MQVKQWVWVVAIAAALSGAGAHAQGHPCGEMSAQDAAQAWWPLCTDSQTITSSGSTVTVRNNGAVTAGFEEVISGSPATVSIVIAGCSQGGTCDTLDTNTTVANAIRSPSIGKAYAYYKVTASWTGGTGVSVAINSNLSTALNSSGASFPGCSSASGGISCTGALAAASVVSGPNVNRSAAISAWGDSLTIGNEDTLGDSYPSDLQADTTRVVKNYGIAGQTSTQILSRFANAPNTYNDLTIIWSGRNDITYGDSLTTLEANIASMVTALPSGGRYVIMTIIPAQNEPAGSGNANSIATVNAWIESTYPNNYLDIRALLINDYNPANGADVANNGSGLTPMSLRAVDGTTTLSASLNTTACPSLTATSVTPNIGAGTTIFIPSGPEYVVVTAASGGTITGCTRGYGGAAGSYSSGTAVQILDSLHQGANGYGFIASQLQAWINANDIMAPSHSPLFYRDNLNNTAVGDMALSSTSSGASNNTALGLLSQPSTSTGTANSSAGAYSLYTNTTGYNNAAFGYQAEYGNTTGNSNAAFGAQALYTNTTGNNNTALGVTALLNSTTASNNTAVGNGALTGATTGNNNVAVGGAAGKAVTTGGSNVIAGLDAAYYLTTGSSNITVGTNAGWTSSSNALTTASNDTFIGAGSAPSTSTQNNYMTVIGSGATANCANCVSLGRASDTVELPGGMILPNLIYSAAGTPVPTCNSGAKGLRAEVSDATSPTFLGAYTSGGAVLSPVVCNGTGWVTY